MCMCAHAITSTLHWLLANCSQNLRQWERSQKREILQRLPLRRRLYSEFNHVQTLGNLLAKSSLRHKSTGHQTSLFPVLTELWVRTAAALCSSNFLLPPEHVLCSCYSRSHFAAVKDGNFKRNLPWITLHIYSCITFKYKADYWYLYSHGRVQLFLKGVFVTKKLSSRSSGGFFLLTLLAKTRKFTFGSFAPATHPAHVNISVSPPLSKGIWPKPTLWPTTPRSALM